MSDPRSESARRVPLGLRELLDALFVLLLTGVALLGLRTTFAGSGYLVAGLVAALVGVLLSSAATYWRRPVWLLALAVVPVYYLFAGVLVFRADAIGGVLPNGIVLREASAVLVDGWKQLLTTLPPVASDGRLLAVPYVIGLIAGVGGACVAQRTSSRFGPAVLPAAALAAVILLGTAQASALLLQGLAFGVVVIVWAALRRPGAKPMVLKVGPGAPQRVLVGALVLLVAGGGAAVLRPHLPGADRHRVVLRDYVDPPFDIAAYPSPLVGFRKYTKPAKLLFDQTLFTVTGVPQGVPVRIATMDAYDGAVWGATNGSLPTAPGEALDAFQRVGSQITVPSGGRTVRTDVRIQAPYAASTDVNAWVPGVGALRSIRFTGPNAAAHADSFRYNLATTSGISAQRLAAGDEFRSEAISDPVGLARGDEPAGAPTLDTGTIGFVGSRASQWAGKAEGVMAQAANVARYMRQNGAYSDGGPGESQYLPGHSTGRLTAFLNAPQLVGDDEQYAAAYALIANYLGLPARVVLLAEPQADGVVKGENVHTAVEVHVRSGNTVHWALLERDVFMPDQDKNPNQQPPQTEQNADAAVVPPPNPVQPPSTLDQPDRPDQNTQQIGRPPRKQTGALSGWFGTVLTYVGLPLLVIALICGLIVGIKWRRRTLRRTRGSVPNRFDAGWREFLDTARDLGASVPRGRTRTEQAAALAERPAGQSATSLAHGADRGVFAAGEPPVSALDEYWDEVQQARRELARAAGRWGTVRAALNLRSLRPSRLSG